MIRKDTIMMEYIITRRNFIKIMAVGSAASLIHCQKRETAVMKLRPHHLLDIITDYGRGSYKNASDFKPYPPMGHAVHTVAKAVLSDQEIKVEFIVGADEICKPCKYLRPDGICADSLRQISPPMSKQEYNDNIDNRLFLYLGLAPGAVMTVREFLEIVNEKVPGIEKVCTHTFNDQKSRLEGLTKGLIKLGIRSNNI